MTYFECSQYSQGFGGMSIAKSEEEKKTVAGAIKFKQHEKYLKLY